MRSAQTGAAMRFAQVGERFSCEKNRAAMASGLSCDDFTIFEALHFKPTAVGCFA
jgi:hypothetical protein